MKRYWRTALLVFVGFIAGWPHKIVRAQTLSIPHPDDPAKRVEYFLEKPTGNGPWPTVVFLHGHQQSPSGGGKDFVKWGVLDDFSRRGYLAVAVSQPGYGNSTGPADFCGPFTQHAVAGVLARLRADGNIEGNKILIEGISRGALVAGFVAARDPSIRGIVLISGLYDLAEFVHRTKSSARWPWSESSLLIDSMERETGGTENALKARSLLTVAQNIKAKALILNGAKDDRTDADQARRLAEVINSHGGQARAIVYPEYGHQIPIELRNKDVEPFIAQVFTR